MNILTQDRARRIRKKYRKLPGVQTGCEWVRNLAKLGLDMGSKAVNSMFGKKLIDEGIKQTFISHIFIGMGHQK